MCSETPLGQWRMISWSILSRRGSSRPVPGCPWVHLSFFVWFLRSLSFLTRTLGETELNASLSRALSGSLCLALALAATAPLALAQDEDDDTLSPSLQTAALTFPDLVFSASKNELPVYRLTRSVSLVTDEEMKDRQATSVVDALKQTPGVFVANQGGPGQMSGVSIRGSKPYDTQFRFDDFPLRDLAATQSDFSGFLGSLMLGEGALGRIEILKGSESTLYGSSAMGGVVSLYSPRKWASGFEGSVRGEAGSFETGRLSANMSYGNDGLDGGPKWVLHATPTATSTEGYRDIWFKQTGVTAGGGIQVSDATTLEFTSLTSVSKGVTSLLGFTPTPADAGRQRPESDEDYFATRLFLNGLTVNHDVSDIWSSRLKVAYTRSERLYHGSWSSAGTSGAGRDTMDGNTLYAEALNTVHPTDFLTVLGGVDYEGSRVLIKNAQSAFSPANKTDEKTGNYAAFGKTLFGFFDDTLNINLGARTSYHTEHGVYTTFDSGVSYLFPTQTKIYANVASGYRSPSMYEMWGVAFGTVYGNPDLKPEKSMNYEVGVDQALWDGRVHLGGALFWTNYRDRIAAKTWADPYENLNRSKVKGWEVTASVSPVDWASVDLGFTHAQTENLTPGNSWQDDRSLPENKAVGTLVVKPIDDLTLAVSSRWESSRAKTMISGYKDDAYATMDVAVAYKLNKNWEVYGRVDNLFDEDYTVQAYGMPGIAAYGGLRVTF